MIRLLLESGNQGTVRQLALGFVGVDEAQIRLYEERIKKIEIPQGKWTPNMSPR